MRTSLLLIISFAAVVCAIAMPATAWTFIPHEDPKIQKLGLWAVVEHNKQAHDGITFMRVASAEKQDLDYQLLVHAMYKTQERGVFTTVVRADASGNARKLISFDPII